MTFNQKLLLSVLPPPWARAMRTESERWKIRCPCDYERSVWEAGGIRWMAKGRSRQLMVCPQCKQRTWHEIYVP